MYLSFWVIAAINFISKSFLCACVLVVTKK